MGNLCGGSVYSQIKDIYPQDFQKYLQMTQVAHQMQERVKLMQKDVDKAKTNVQKKSTSTLDGKQKQVQEHFAIVRNNINRYYPGGVKFLQESKHQKVEDLLGMSAFDTQFDEIRTSFKRQFSREERRVNQEIDHILNDELDKAKSQTPSLPQLQKLTPIVRKNVEKIGLREYRKSIDEKRRASIGQIDRKLNAESLVEGFNGLLPVDRLNNLAETAKGEVSARATNFIGSPDEGRATLF